MTNRKTQRVSESNLLAKRRARSSDTSSGLSALIFQHNDLICPTDTGLSHSRVPPLHRIDGYWAIAVESGRCGSREQIDFDMKSVFQQSFRDLILQDNGELPGFMLYLAERGKEALLDQLIVAVRLPSPVNASVRLVGNTSLPRIQAQKIRLSELKRDEDPAIKEKRDKLWSHLETKFYPSYLTSRYHYRFQRQVLRERLYALKDFLYYEHAIRHLREFLEQEEMTGLLSFWLACDNFRQCVANKTYESAEEIKLDAMAIYQKYIGLGSPYYLGLDEAVRASIECSISPKPEDDQQINANCFNQAMWIVYAGMHQVFTRRFPSSIMYMAFLEELTRLAASDDDLGRSRRVHDGRKDNVMSIGILDSLGRYVRKSSGDGAGLLSLENGAPDLESEQALRFAQNFVNDVIYRNTSCVAKIETS